MRILSFRSIPLPHVTLNGSDAAHRSPSASHEAGAFRLEEYASSCHPMAEDRWLPTSSCGERVPPTAPNVWVDKLAKSPEKRSRTACGFKSRSRHQNSCADRGMANSPRLERGICGFDSHSAHQFTTSSCLEKICRFRLTAKTLACHARDGSSTLPICTNSRGENLTGE